MVIEDIIITSSGDLKITYIGHASLYFTFNDKIIHIDPVSSQADYSTLPKADIIFITHEHGDHFDSNAIGNILTDTTTIVYTERCSQILDGGIIMRNGDTQIFDGIEVEAVPAYNIVNTQYHPKGIGNGYVFTFGDKRVYVAGDTENIPEMKALKNIDVAFLPMNLPYTMTPEMVVEAAKSFMPKILYIYHYRGSDTDKLSELMKEVKEVELRIRKMY